MGGDIMVAIHTVLCPVDFSDATARQVMLAAALSRHYGSRLVLHHNLTSLAAGAGVGWMWSADHPVLSEAAVGRRLEEVALTYAPGMEVELRITEGPASSAVLAISDAVNADLVVLTTHRVRTEDHTSVTARVLERSRRSVLALHDEPTEVQKLRFDLDSGHPQVTLVPTHLTPESRVAVEFAFELARTLPLELHLLHLKPHGAGARRREGADADAERALRTLIPDDLIRCTHVHVREGEPDSGIVHFAAEIGAACIVMGEHTRAPLRRWFSHDTSQGVLHEAPCPVWYVPASPAPA
jgi:nucleotide-binding universal stress UspA family protein